MIKWKLLRRSIPINIKLGRTTNYEVVFVEDFKDGNTLGETRTEPNQIALLINQSDKKMIHTYLHEVLHAISNTYEVGLTEEQVLKLEKAVYYILKPKNIFK